MWHRSSYIQQGGLLLLHPRFRKLHLDGSTIIFASCTDANAEPNFDYLSIARRDTSGVYEFRSMAVLRRFESQHVGPITHMVVFFVSVIVCSSIIIVLLLPLL